VACPYFFPEAEIDFAARPKPARAPLGTVFTGTCHADPAAPVTPSESLLYEACNFGYGRRTCPLFPADATADAVRFTSYNGAVLYVLEMNYSPVEHGTCDAGLPTPVLARQAQVFTETCLRK
jgi:hypothetical protein